MGKWCWISVPDHEGVMNVGGRVGSAQGPASAWKAFLRLKGRDGVHERLAERLEAGGFKEDVAFNHRQAADRVVAGHRAHGVSVVLGGGHDHGYSHLLGLSEALPKGARLGCINIDAHLDVRKPAPLISSGSPFYLAMENGVLKPENFIEFGIQRLANAPELWDYIESKKGAEVVLFDTLRLGRGPEAFGTALSRLASRCDALAVSFDLDACAQAVAPGVSAPVSEGFSADEIMAMMAQAGSEKKCVSLGIFELNPAHDVDDRTSRLAASAVYHFVAAKQGA